MASRLRVELLLHLGLPADRPDVRKEFEAERLVETMSGLENAFRDPDNPLVRWKILGTSWESKCACCGSRCGISGICVDCLEYKNTQ